jgi:RND family efflux transporter MFP subunit
MGAKPAQKPEAAARRAIRWLAAAAVPALCALLAGCGDSKPGGAAAGSAAKPGGPREFPVRTTAAATMPVTYDIRVVGSLVEENRFVVPARVAGTAQDVGFKEGDRVTTGQQLLRIEHDRYRLLADKADASVREQDSVVKKYEADLAETVRKTSSTIDTARVDLDLAKSEFDRRATLQGAAISEEDRFTAELKYRRAKAVFDYAVAAVNTQVALADAALTEQKTALEALRVAAAIARDDLDKAVVRAPIEGAILERQVTDGQYLKLGDELAVMVQMNPLRLKLTVPESQSAVLTRDTSIEFTVPAYPSRKFAAQVYDVAGAADPSTREVAVWARVDNTEGALRPGYFAKAALAVGSAKSAIVIPLAAVQPTEAGMVCFVVQDNRAIQRRVQTGIQVTGDSVEIVSGLEPGEQVVVEGVASLSNNVPVKVVGARSGAISAVMPTDGATSPPADAAGAKGPR